MEFDRDRGLQSRKINRKTPGFPGHRFALDEQRALQAASARHRGRIAAASAYTRDAERARNDAHRARGGAASLWRGAPLAGASAACVHRPAWYQRPLSVVGAALLWIPDIPRDTALEEYVAVVVFALLGLAARDARAAAFIRAADALVPGCVVVVGCWVFCFVVVAGVVWLIEGVEKADAFRVVRARSMRLEGDEDLDLEARLHRATVREKSARLEALWAAYDAATADHRPAPRRLLTAPSAGTLDRFLESFEVDAAAVRDSSRVELAPTASERNLGLLSPEPAAPRSASARHLPDLASPLDARRKATLPPLDGAAATPPRPLAADAGPAPPTSAAERKEAPEDDDRPTGHVNVGRPTGRTIKHAESDYYDRGYSPCPGSF